MINILLINLIFVFLFFTHVDAKFDNKHKAQANSKKIKEKTTDRK